MIILHVGEPAAYREIGATMRDSTIPEYRYSRHAENHLKSPPHTVVRKNMPDKLQYSLEL